MSYASLIKILPETLRSSTGKAALASLGIHGLLGVVLPVLPFDSKPVESQLQTTVGLIELTPAEQSRLPQVSTPQVTIPPVATQPSGLPPLPPASSLPPSVLPPLPPVSSLPPGVLPPLPPPPVLNLPPSGVPPVYNYPLRASLPQPQTIQVPFDYAQGEPFDYAQGTAWASSSRARVCRGKLPPATPLDFAANPAIA